MDALGPIYGLSAIHRHHVNLGKPGPIPRLAPVRYERDSVTLWRPHRVRTVRIPVGDLATFTALHIRHKQVIEGITPPALAVDAIPYTPRNSYILTLVARFHV